MSEETRCQTTKCKNIDNINSPIGLKTIAGEHSETDYTGVGLDRFYCIRLITSGIFSIMLVRGSAGIILSWYRGTYTFVSSVRTEWRITGVLTCRRGTQPRFGGFIQDFMPPILNVGKVNVLFVL